VCSGPARRSEVGNRAVFGICVPGAWSKCAATDPRQHIGEVLATGVLFVASRKPQSTVTKQPPSAVKSVLPSAEPAPTHQAQTAVDDAEKRNSGSADDVAFARVVLSSDEHWETVARDTPNYFYERYYRRDRRAAACPQSR
jgi:hypothetical protein